MATTILLIEDDPASRELARFNLRKAGYTVDSAEDGEAGLARFDPARHSLVVTDVKMPGVSGLDVLRRVKAISPDTPVLVVTAFGGIDTAVESMKAGAADFIVKPFNRDQMLLAMEKALADRSLREEVRSLRLQTRGIERPLVCRSEAMHRVVELADRVASSDASVLITGETGTGKEVLARRIHARSPRVESPFAVVNCAAIPAALLEAELFGHEKGAFTGADRAREGRFRQANGGTLLLDEVGDLPLELQPKLLRCLQEHAVDPVGSDRPAPVDVRVLAATHRDLRAEIAAGRFREDLFYRIDVVELHVPPLRERPEDIEALARHFVERVAQGRDPEVGDDVLAELRSRPWPGNVRELENACERLVILSDGARLDPSALPPRSAGRAGDEWPPLPPEGLSLVDLEKRVIERALRLNRWNVSQTAAYLRIPRHILVYRLEKHGIRRET
jgi:two-component system NtrC family response regulator